MLKPGLYEQVINQQLTSELSSIPEARKAVAPIDKAEASKVLAQYLADVVQRGLDNVIDNGGDISAQIALTNQIVDLIQTTTKEADFASMGVAQRAEQLLALLRENDPRLLLGKTAADMERPETSVAQSSLFTGAIHEPQMFSELKKEINSADQIDMLVSFIKWSGLRLIMDELREFTQNGGQLRIITTSYMGATDIKAIEELSRLPNTEIKVSYDTKRTRLHAKTYVFYRDTGFTTAYVGSSNLSNAAISSGLEWNVKVTAKDLPSTIQKIIATFDSYWNSSEFEFYKEEERERLFRALRAERMMGNGSSRTFVFDIHPYPYQLEILDKLNAEREVRGRNRNLVVAATGTGKTVISAFDYRRFCKANPGQRNRLLFVAHREEILKKSRDTFQGVLKDPNFGELFVGSYKPASLDYLFISVQTVNSQALYDSFSADYYDYIVVDEFHHAAAPTYQKLLNHFNWKLAYGVNVSFGNGWRKLTLLYDVIEKYIEYLIYIGFLEKVDYRAGIVTRTHSLIPPNEKKARLLENAIRRCDCYGPLIDDEIEATLYPSEVPSDGYNYTWGGGFDAQDHSSGDPILRGIENRQGAEREIGYGDAQNHDFESGEPFFDCFGKRWVVCKCCGQIKREDEMKSYGGRGSENKGICNECSGW